mgnify:CR=1 FL=1
MNLKEIETQRANLLEQIKVMKFQERDVIEKILKTHFSEFVELAWYDDNENYFKILSDDFNFEKLQNVSIYLENWKIRLNAYDNDCIEIEFNRKVEI